jgi:hypothetical protein
MNKFSAFVWRQEDSSNDSATENGQIAEPFKRLDDQVSGTGKAV